MSLDYAIEVDNVVKNFKIYYDKGTTIKEKVVSKNRRKYEVRTVLDGISFQVKRGEAVGLIGHNGCGKSTTLKLLTRIMYPDNGNIKIRGRVSSLIELGAGFHPDMSGRENIYINASIFGLTRKEIDSRLAEIIEFSELKDYIDNPVRTYSSGMYMRLAFSIAINVNADVLLIDEILAVGDVNFQAKCFNKLRDIKAKGATIVIVSHSLPQIEQICEESIWINNGKIEMIGAPRDVHPAYMDFMGQKQQDYLVQQKESHARKEQEGKAEKVESVADIEEPDKDSDDVENQGAKLKEAEFQEKRWGNGKARITNIRAFDDKETDKVVFATGETIVLKVEFKVKEIIEDATFGIGIFRGDGLSCYGTNTRIDKVEKFDLRQDGSFQIVLKDTNLLPAEYSLDIAIQDSDGGSIDYYREAYKIQIYSTINDIGVFRINHEWKY